MCGRKKSNIAQHPCCCCCPRDDCVPRQSPLDPNFFFFFWLWWVYEKRRAAGSDCRNDWATLWELFGHQWQVLYVLMKLPVVCVPLIEDSPPPQKREQAANNLLLQNYHLRFFFFGQKHLFFITKTFLKFVCQQAVYQQKRFGDESISKGPFFPFKVLMDLFDCLCRLHPILHFSYFIKKKKKAFCLFSPFSVVRIRSRRRQTPRLLLPHLHKDCGRRCATQSARGWQVIQTRSTSLSVTNLSVYWIYKKEKNISNNLTFISARPHLRIGIDVIG